MGPRGHVKSLPESSYILFQATEKDKNSFQFNPNTSPPYPHPTYIRTALAGALSFELPVNPATEGFGRASPRSARAADRSTALLALSFRYGARTRVASFLISFPVLTNE